MKRKFKINATQLYKKIFTIAIYAIIAVMFTVQCRQDMPSGGDEVVVVPQINISANLIPNSIVVPNIIENVTFNGISQTYTLNFNENIRISPIRFDINFSITTEQNTTISIIEILGDSIGLLSMLPSEIRSIASVNVGINGDGSSALVEVLLDLDILESNFTNLDIAELAEGITVLINDIITVSTSFSFMLDSVMQTVGLNSNDKQTIWQTLGQRLRMNSNILVDTDSDGLIDAVDPDDDNDGVNDEMDIDDDGDGLIELSTIDMLNNMRFNLNGSSYKANASAVGITTGCSNGNRITTCNGYELVRDLNFMNPSHYASGVVNTDFTMGNGWEPIGSNSAPFTGIFDGNLYTISNLLIDDSNRDYVGFFGYTTSEIRNTQLDSVSVNGRDYVGGLVGYQGSGTISNSYATGRANGNSNIGGLVGRQQSGTIINSYAMGSVSGRAQAVGGLVGWQQSGTITNSYATGSVSGRGQRVGGLVGQQNGNITNSYATGRVSGSVHRVGGLVGEQNGNITNSYATGRVIGTGRGMSNSNYVGGLVGWQESGTITNSSATGNVSGRAGAVGGLVGWQESGTITNSSATGSVSGIGDRVGGLVGGQVSGTITDSYAKGRVDGSTNVGGLVGRQESGTITNSSATGIVVGSNQYVGGLVGLQDSGTITNSSATGNVSGSMNHVGGLVGEQRGAITNSYATGNVNGSMNYVGGLVGYQNSGTISSSYATGMVIGSSSNRVGGLVGEQQGAITNSYATGNVSGMGSEGLVGGLVGQQQSGTISNSYATGMVSGSSGGGNISGFVGLQNGTITNCFWDVNTSMQSMGVGANTSSASTNMLTSLTTIQMQNDTGSITMLGNAFIYTPSNAYPILRYQGQTAELPGQRVSGLSFPIGYGYLPFIVGMLYLGIRKIVKIRK